MEPTYNNFLKFNPKINKLFDKSRNKYKPLLEKIDDLMLYNQGKVLNSFKKLKISEDCFSSSTGYGYHDFGREKLEMLFAEVFGGEAALVRPHLVSGTHTLAVSLFGLLRPGDEVISLTGKPYDSLHPVIGSHYYKEGWGSLKEWGIAYKEIMCDDNGDFPEYNLGDIMSDKTKMVTIQRSRGYRLDRPALTIPVLKNIINNIRAVNKEVIIFVDNCYGEFVEEEEPLDCGADIIAGSLIKNPGGGLVPIGGYIAGKESLIEKVAHRLTAPGLGDALGAFHDVKRLFYQGLFIAPQLVGNALKTAVIAAAIFKDLGFSVYPGPEEKRGDIVQAILLNSPQLLEAFCSAIQHNSPIDSYLTPQAAELAGYKDPVIMAGGTFIQGASSELSADGPFKEPYPIFLQGSLTFEHGLLGILAAAEEVYNKISN